MSDLISRQAAIDALHMHLMYRMGTDSNKKRLDDWINSLPSAQPEQSIAQERYEDLCEYFKDCSDQGRSILTDRKEFKSWLDRMKWHVIECDKLGRELEKLKSAQPKTGKWIPTQNPQWKAYYHDKCSVCGWWNTKNAVCRDSKKKAHSLNYCPNCGAMMKEGEEHD